MKKNLNGDEMNCELGQEIKGIWTLVLTHPDGDCLTINTLGDFDNEREVYEELYYQNKKEIVDFFPEYEEGDIEDFFYF